jgi:hypothetical protein
MKKIYSIIIISLFYFSAVSANEPLKKFYINCEGLLDIDGKVSEKFFQDIELSYYKNKKNGRFISYTITATSHTILRPLTAISGSIDHPLKSKALQQIYIKQGLSAVSDGWNYGVFRVYSTTQDKYISENGNKIVQYSEVLNVNLNTLSINMKVYVKSINNVGTFIGRANCKDNKKLLRFLYTLQ